MKKLIKPPYYRYKVAGVIIGIVISTGIVGLINRDWIVDEGSVSYANLTAGRELKAVYLYEFEEIQKLFFKADVKLNIKTNEEPCRNSNFNKFRGSVDCGVGNTQQLVINNELSAKWLNIAPEIEKYLADNGWRHRTYGSYGTPPTLTESIGSEFWASTSYTKKIGSDMYCSLDTDSRLETSAMRINTGCSRSVDFFGGFVKGSVW